MIIIILAMHHNFISMLVFTIIIVLCPSLKLNNGTINCSLGDDGVPSYGDICTITCHAGYELIGSSNRTCQGDGNWSGTMAVCANGTYSIYTVYVCIYICMYACMYECI